MSHILEVSDLEVSFSGDGGKNISVDHISFYVDPGEVVCIVGESGCGKSVTSLSIMGLLGRGGSVTSGRVLFEGKNLLAMTEKELDQIRGDRLTMIFQDPLTSLNPVFTIGNQMTESIRAHMGLGKEEAAVRALMLLKKVGLPDAAAVMRRYPHLLSGGMRQRVMIAMALSCSPSLLVADEPTTALDVTIQAQVLGMMEELKERFGTSMLLITHDLGVVAQTCDRVAIMYAGEIVEHGSIEDIFTGKEHHPYTQGLFGSIPSTTGDAKRLNPIAGLMPDPTNLPRGCKFHTRCPHCMEVCRQSLPQVYRHGTHEIACHLYVGDGEPGSKASYGKNGEPGSKAEGAGIAESAGEEVGRV